MKVANLTYTEALQRHPEETAKIVKGLRKSRSKMRNTPAEELTWTYECCVQVTAFSLQDFVSGKALAAQRRSHTMTLEEKVADQVARTMTQLQATVGRWFGSESVANPPEVAKHARKCFQEVAAEQVRVDSLSKEEQDEEIAGLLKQLGKSPGFMHFQVRK